MLRLALVALATLSLVACSKTDKTNPADAAASDSAAPASTAAADAAAIAPQADANAGGNAAIKAPHEENAGPPAAGANSFTEGQARGHIENSGYTNVTDLSKDYSGLWHAKAMKGGQSVAVSLDFKGNVVTK